LNPRPLGYEPYDMRLRRLSSLRPPRWPRQTCDVRSSQAFYVSPVSARPIASRAQIRFPACRFLYTGCLLAVGAHVIDAGVVGDSVSLEPLTPSVSGLLSNLAHVRPARSWCLALLAGRGRDNPQSTISSGTQRARSRLRRPPTRSREFVRSTCVHSVGAAACDQGHSAYLPDHGVVERPTVCFQA
jgi:hypothetical protein